MGSNLARDSSRTPSARGSNAALVIGASSLGTVFEWYDFFLYAAVATLITQHFFSATNETTGYIFALLAFAAGFAVRPLGGLVFGRLGDLWGRRNTFLVTMIIMGLSTVLIGVIPDYASIGIWAPILLIAARLLQGLAMGGEYGGAATFVAEHAPNDRRGLYTSFIQVTATAGLALSLGVVLIVRSIVGEEAFTEWGWRVPFLLSIVLLAISMWIRFALEESPIFQQMVREGKRSPKPLAETLGEPSNLRKLFVGVFALSAGMTVVWYTSQFYTLFFLDRVLKVETATATTLVAIALILASPLFVFFGWLSDKVGRKPIIVAGCILAAVSFFPLFNALTAAANPALYYAARNSPVVVHAPLSTCNLQFDPIGRSSFLSPCDLLTTPLARAGVSYSMTPLTAGEVAHVQIGSARVESFDAASLAREELAAHRQALQNEIAAALEVAGYPARADPEHVDKGRVLLILFAMIAMATMCYGPLAAALAELFATRVRYTSVSFSYNIAVGWIGGFLPAVAFAMVAASGDIFFGVWYPTTIAALSALIAIIFVKDRWREPLPS